MTETARSEESDREGSDQGDGLKRASNARSFITDNKSPDYAANCEKHNDTASHGNNNPQPLHQRMDAIKEQRKVEDEMEYARRTNLNIQSAIAAQDVFLRAGYDMRPYYGWLPGIAAPVRFPALIYPPTFFGFAPPNVDGTRKEESNGLNGDANDSKCEENKAESGQLVRGNVERGSTTCEGHKGFLAHNDDFGKLYNNNNNNDALQHDAKSDVDEGLELDEYETKNVSKILNMRRRSPDELLSQTRVAATTVSVIQQNCTLAQKFTKNATDDDVSDDSESTEEAIKRLTKRGRASTRRIEKTEQYWDRRKKNNVSAKKSRDARRQREIGTNHRSAMLEAENLRLRAEVATLKDENERLKKELSNVTSLCVV